MMIASYEASGRFHCRVREQIAKEDAAHASEVFLVQSPVVVPRLSLVLHGPQPHAEPLVQALEEVADIAERGSEIVRYPANRLVHFDNDYGVQIAMSDGKIPDCGLEFLHALGAHRHGPRVDPKPEEQKPLEESGRLGLFGTERKPNAGEVSLHSAPFALRL